MNVYDFDGTIYVGDTELSFFELIYEKLGTFPWKWNYKLHEWLAAKRLMHKTKAREREYSFLKYVHNLDELMEEYWKRNEKNVLDWYLEVRRPDDVIASGTPAFILEPYIKKLGLEGRLVATDMDPKTGKVKGRFCVMDEKLEAFKRQFPGEKIEKFYSDSWNDRFLADYAEQSFAIDKDYKQHDWKEYFDQHPEKQIIPYDL